MAAEARGGEHDDPLPHGWERRYDGSSSRYFYVDCINEVTAWERPVVVAAPSLPSTDALAKPPAGAALPAAPRPASMDAGAGVRGADSHEAAVEACDLTQDSLAAAEQQLIEMGFPRSRVLEALSTADVDIAFAVELVEP